MKSYEVYMCRRKALGITKEKMAELCRTTVDVIEDFEDGIWIDRDILNRIKDVCYQGFRSVETIEHYQLRILELAMELKIETSIEHGMQKIGHMMIELGKLQMELLTMIS